MLIGICGGECAGKSSVQDYLIQQHGFRPLKIRRPAATPSSEPSTSAAHVPPPNDARHNPDHAFDTATDLLDFATTHWQQHWATTSIHSEAIADTLLHRPFFVLLHIDAPLIVRYDRIVRRCNATLRHPPSLEQFVCQNDARLYNPRVNLAALPSRAHIRLYNPVSSPSRLHAALAALNLPDPSRLRPSWDHYFMTLAALAARRSNCMRRQVGCVLVRAHRVISTGYNGTPRGITNCLDGGCARCNGAVAAGGGGQGLSTCLCLHAEENALLEAGRERVGAGSVLYCNTCPCLTCSIKIAQVGIAEVVYNQSYYMDADAARIFDEAGVRLRQFSPPREGMVNLGLDYAAPLPAG